MEEHGNGEDEQGGADGTGQRAGTTMRGWHSGREEPDPGRVRGCHRLPSEAREARPAVGIDGKRHRRPRWPTHLRRRGPWGAGGSLGGVGPDLRQPAEGADAYLGRRHGEARPPAAGAGHPRRASCDEPGDDRPLAARGPGTGREEAAPEGPHRQCARASRCARSRTGTTRRRASRRRISSRTAGRCRRAASCRRWWSPTSPPAGPNARRCSTASRRFCARSWARSAG